MTNIELTALAMLETQTAASCTVKSKYSIMTDMP